MVFSLGRFEASVKPRIKKKSSAIHWLLLTKSKVKSVPSFNVSLNGKSQMCKKEQIVPRIGKQKALARSKHIQMHCSNILKKEAWQADLLAFYYYLYYRCPQGEPIVLELLRPVPEHLWPAPHQPLFQNHVLQEGHCKKYEMQIKHIVTRLFHVSFFKNRNGHYDEYTPKGNKGSQYRQIKSIQKGLFLKRRDV